MNKVVVYFSNKCHTCFDHMKEMSKRLSFEKIDVDEKPELYEELNLNITPTTILYKNGKEVWRCEGMMFDKQYEEMRRM